MHQDASAPVRPGEDRYTLAARASLDGFWEWDLQQGTFYYSPRWQAIAGFEAVEFAGTLEHWLSLAHPADRPRLEAELKAQAAGKSHSFHYEHRLLHCSGIWRRVTARGICDPGSGRVAGSLHDHSGHESHDALTGLPNRNQFLDHLQRRFQSGQENDDWNFAVVSLDLDRFKFINESLGFDTGDALLMEAARRLTHVLQKEGLDQQSLVTRTTDAEFSVLLDGVAEQQRALEVAASLHDEMSRPFPIRKRKTSFAVPMGIAMADGTYENPEDLLRDADMARHQVKVHDHATPVCFSSGMRERTLKVLQLESELRNAIETDELMLYYQPEVDLASQRIIGFEALIRWKHPERGVVEPSEFIPMAEETGLIVPLGDWGLAEACRQMTYWRALTSSALNLRVSVNLSARQFNQANLVERISDILSSTGVRGSDLSLEMTESSLMNDADTALKTMQHLRRLGIGLHMDDFGTGYSSLNHLHRFPFDTLKIDRSFVMRMTEEKESQEIVNTIVSMARSLKMSVIAEGIENADQMRWLRSMGCHFGQGYYFAKPMLADDISQLILSNTFNNIPWPHPGHTGNQ